MWVRVSGPLLPALIQAPPRARGSGGKFELAGGVELQIPPLKCRCRIGLEPNHEDATTGRSSSPLASLTPRFLSPDQVTLGSGLNHRRN